MPISATKRQLDEELTSFLWRQWVQLGVFGEELASDRWAIDPEVLLLLTFRLGARDPRLFDEVLDWLCLNGQLVSVQRLRNITRNDETSRRLVDAALNWAGSHNPSLHGWVNRQTPKKGVEPISLGAVRVSQPDERFISYGVLWPRVEPSGNSSSPDTSTPAAFGFRLRNLFGVGARAEIVRFLLTSMERDATAQRVAEATGFAKRNVHETLAALAEAGPIMVDRRGNELTYTLRAAGWAAVLDLSNEDSELAYPKFLDWIALERALVPLALWLDASETGEQSRYLLASNARELLDRIRPDLRRIDIVVPDDRAALGDAYLSVFQDTVARLSTRMRG